MHSTDDVSDCDVVVVGTGATGGWAAKQLTEGGLQVVILEAGHAFDLEADFPSSVELAALASAGTLASRERIDRRFLERQFVQSRRGEYNETTRRCFVDDVDNPYTTPDDQPFDWIRCRTLGGRTLLWGGLMPRWSDYEFKAASRDGIGTDWPIGHDTLAPSYEVVERFLGVRGEPEHLPHLPDGIFASRFALTEGEQELKTRVEARWPDRRVTSVRGVAAGPTEWLPYLYEHPRRWPTFTSVGSTLAAAAATGRLVVRSGAIVSRVVIDERNPDHARGVSYVDHRTGREHMVRADAVVLCASTIESTRILLHSASPVHPRGVGNSSGVLGRYLMDHPALVVAGAAPSASAPVEGVHGILIPKFRNLEQRESNFVRGYGVFGSVGRAGPMALLCAMCEMLPRVDNHVELDRLTRDAWGIPSVRICCSYSDNERRMLEDARQELLAIAATCGWTVEASVPTRPGWFVHDVGTARMGCTPSDSVLNEWCQCWDVPNIYVTDGACFVSSGWQNPTLTMMALTVRACEHLLAALQPRRHEPTAHGAVGRSSAAAP